MRPAALHAQEDAVLFQMAHEQVGDADIQHEGSRHPPERCVVWSIGADGVADDLMKDVGRQRILTEGPKEANLPVAQIRKQEK